MYKFLVKIVAGILVLGLLVLGLNKLYMDKRNGETDKFQSVPNGIKVCNFGSSHGLNSFCYDNIDSEYVCFNFAMGSQSLQYDKRILEFYKDHIESDAVVYIPVSYFSLFGIAENLDTNFESINQRYYDFLPENMITDYNRRTEFYRNYPVLTAYENMVDILFSQGKDQSAYYTQTADDIDLAANVQMSYMRHIVRNKTDSDGNRIVNFDNLTALYDMIGICREIGARPVLVTTPLLREYTDKVWNESPEVLALQKLMGFETRKH